MRRNSKSNSNPPSNVIDRTFEFRLTRKYEEVENEKQRQHAESEVLLMLEADRREARLVSLFQKLPADRQHDVLAIAEVYHEHYGSDGLAES